MADSYDDTVCNEGREDAPESVPSDFSVDLILDATPLSLGLETANGRVYTIIPRHTVIPVQHVVKNVTTVQDFQPSITMHVLQGESAKAQNNRLLGRFILDGIFPAPRGVPQIEVVFDIDKNGILSIKAWDKLSESEQNITITASSGLSMEEIEKMGKETGQNTVDHLWQEEGLFSKAETALYVANRMLLDLGDLVDTDQKAGIQMYIRNLRKALINEQIDKCVQGVLALTQSLSSLMYSLRDPRKNAIIDGTQGEPENATIDESNLVKQFRVCRVLEGGMGKVFVSEDRQLAFKTLRDDLCRDDNAIKRFVNEARTWISLGRHSNLVTAFLVKEYAGKPYVFLEYVEDGDLSLFAGNLDIAQVTDIGIQICDAMQYANQTMPGLVHRDIKPSNVLLKKSDEFESGFAAKITDFGLAKTIGQSDLEDEVPTYAGTELSRGPGTFSYMPPEQFPDYVQDYFSYETRPLTEKADIYAFGVLLYEVLIGEKPFYDLTDIFNKTPEFGQTTRINIPYQLRQLIAKCMEKKPEDRYHNFLELSEGLENIFKDVTRKKYHRAGKPMEISAADWIARGLSLNTLREYSEGLTCFLKALQASQHLDSVWIGMGDSYAGLGDWQQAILHYDKVKESYAALAGKARCMNSIGNYEQAVHCYTEAHKAYLRQGIGSPHG